MEMTHKVTDNKLVKPVDQMVPVTQLLMKLMFERVRDHGCGMWYSAKRKRVPTAPGALWHPIRKLARQAVGTADWSCYLQRVPIEPLFLLERLERKGGQLAEDAFLFAQILRIPATETCTIQRLLQIAFDAGQLVGSSGITRLARVNEGFIGLYGTMGLGLSHHYCDDPTMLKVPVALVELISRLPTN
jgi:hypothetical protein